MNIHLKDQSIVIGEALDLNDFPDLMKRHSEIFPGVINLEKLAKKLIENDFDPNENLEFIAEVCKWGNYAGIGGKVKKNNNPDVISNAFKEANKYISGHGDIDVSRALYEINNLYGLGSVSFASKHLRFLSPKYCPVYDSILSNKLPYSFDAVGYKEFANDCSVIIDHLNKIEIINPSRESGVWLVADVEASIFTNFYD